MRRMIRAAGAALVLLAGAGFARPAVAQETVRVGSTPTGIPFTFLDTKTNTIQGVMVDVITAIGKQAGFSVQIEPFQFSSLIAALNARKIDAISAAMFITPPRQEVIAFSGPVYSYGEGMVVPKADTKAYTAFSDLKGETVGAQVGTAFVDALKKSGQFPEVKVYDTFPDMLRDVNAGRVKAIFADSPIIAYNLKSGNFPNAHLVASYKPVVVGSVGIGVRKDDTALLAKINAGLAKIKESGELAKILEKWGLQPSVNPS
ncbi:amino acid ABC transporter substrate-binding protein [Methylobacterium currus]|uniref:Amino acid ABC transporter substrate-binding protein n=1 Tax=Methylobacterium currus TaxID=2051553 RepID=A0A2R4WJN2_9HYPH|nr:ABC transporter substrate-binding protein [Methylobacterium currus]AWB21727.1 amino acid ABC transporter substrate-binding protein [Methylobacterium currus]UHC18648.1 ABC transporter substrate-binding protein [Methylobacterium currus]